MSFLSGDPIPANKFFGNPLPGGAAAEGYVLDSDMNFIFGALAEIRSALLPLQATASTLQTTVSSLSDRVTALEDGTSNPPPPPPPPPPPGTGRPNLDVGFPVSASITGSTATSVSVTVPTVGTSRLLIASIQAVEPPSTIGTVSGLGLTWTRIQITTYSSYIQTGFWAAWVPAGNAGGPVSFECAPTATMPKAMMITVLSFSNTKNGGTTAGPIACFGDLEGEETGSDAMIMADGTVANSTLLGCIAWGFNEALQQAANTVFDSTALDSVSGAFLASFHYTGDTGGNITFGGSRTSGVNARAISSAELLGA